MEKRDKRFAPVPDNAIYVDVVELDCPEKMKVEKYKRIENGVWRYYYRSLGSVDHERNRKAV